MVLGCRGGGSDRPQTAAEKRGALGYVFEKNRPFSEYTPGVGIRALFSPGWNRDLTRFVNII